MPRFFPLPPIRCPTLTAIKAAARDQAFSSPGRRSNVRETTIALPFRAHIVAT
jgi:hypothetical protein